MNSNIKKAMLLGSCLLTVGAFGAMAQGPEDECGPGCGPDRGAPPQAKDIVKKLNKELKLTKEQSRKLGGLLQERLNQKREFHKLLRKLLNKKQMRKLREMMRPRKGERGPDGPPLPPEANDRQGPPEKGGKRPDISPQKLGRELNLNPKQADKLSDLLKMEGDHEMQFKKKLSRLLSREQMHKLQDILKKMRDDRRPPRPPRPSQDDRGPGWDD